MCVCVSERISLHTWRPVPEKNNILALRTGMHDDEPCDRVAAGPSPHIKVREAAGLWVKRNRCSGSGERTQSLQMLELASQRRRCVPNNHIRQSPACTTTAVTAATSCSAHSQSPLHLIRLPCHRPPAHSPFPPKDCHCYSCCVRFSPGYRSARRVDSQSATTKSLFL